MKLPKLHLITANDQLRPAMNHVYVNEDHIVASDSDVIVTYSRKVLDNLIHGLPNEFYVDAYQWRMLTTEFTGAIYYQDTNIIALSNKKGIERYLRVKLADQVDFKFPNYKQVIPPTSKAVPVDAIGLSINVVRRFLSVVPENIISLKFHGCHSGILVTCPYDLDFTGVIMPVAISE